jgi:predicted secreted hydrolase
MLSLVVAGILVIVSSSSSVVISLSNMLINSAHAQQVYQMPLVKLPADDAPHDLQTEWWYYNGHIKTGDGQRFSFHYVVFLDNALVTHSAVHVSVTDHQTGQRYTRQLRTGGNPSAGVVDGFNFVFGAWQMSRARGHDLLKVQADDFSFDLSLSDGAPPVFHGGTGLLDFARAGTSYYYSRCRMPVKGSLQLNGRQFSVTGESWFDHQWGDFRASQLNWNWFALQLDGGIDIMLYELRDSQGNVVLNSGTLSKSGTSLNLTDADFDTAAISSWSSKATAITYPMGWRVSIPGQGMDLVLTALHQESEFDARMTTHNAYWEGAISVKGSHTGKGFVELGGYSLKTGSR